jgi:hypothetical protein
LTTDALANFVRTDPQRCGINRGEAYLSRE